MRRVIAIGVLALTAPFTVGATNKAATVSHVLPPATVPSKVNECRAQLWFGANGNAGPLTCANGALNTVAWHYFASAKPPLLVMRLGQYATPRQVQNALCVDIEHNHSTIPIETSAYRLAALYYRWRFGIDPTQVLTTRSCDA